MKLLHLALICACGWYSPGSSDYHSLFSASNDPLLSEALYAKPERLVSHVAPSGAVGANKDFEEGLRTTWFIEQQRYGADLVLAGLVRQDARTRKAGWQILDWGLRKQGPSGDFPGTGDPFHSTSFFLEALSRALLVEKEEGKSDDDSHMSRAIQSASKAAAWMTLSKEETIGKRRNLPYTHRRWLLAAALGETSELLGDRHLEAIAESYARDGLALQTPDGVNPEKGGSDSSYQPVGVLFACRYYYVCHNESLRDEIKQMVLRAMQWELTKVGRTGDVSTEGNSRVGTEVDRRGKLKGIDYKAAVQAFVLASKVTGEKGFYEAAERISRGRRWVGREQE